MVSATAVWHPGVSAAGPDLPRGRTAHVEWSPLQCEFSSDVEGPHLLLSTAQDGSEEDAQRFPEVAT